jgi:hypothetical protein
MKRLAVAFYILMAYAGNVIDVHADIWPKLVNDNKVEQCAEALQIASVMFQSDSSRLYSPPVIPVEFGSALVMKPNGLDISGGDAIWADKAIFEKLPIGGRGAPRSIYWQKTSNYSYRLVLLEIPHGWRGDAYSLFAVEKEVIPEDFIKMTNKEKHRDSRFVPIISYSWRPPLMLRKKTTGNLWIIDVGQPSQFLGDWKVHIAEEEVKLSCTVQFHPRVTDAASLLPKPIQKLVRLLDQSIGPGIDEGTLQPTAGLRIDVGHTLANAALRPWALKEPYNTRDEVDDGLEKWSRNGPNYLKAYKAIKKQYAVAEGALALYYQKNFGKPSDEAKLLAAYSLGIIIRSHFAFHSDDPNSYFRFDGPQFNPWRKNEGKH